MKLQNIQKIFAGRGRLLVFILIPLLVAAGLFAYAWSIPPKLEITFYEVGQAESILFRSSEGKVMLIDGGYPDGRALKKLQGLNVQHIDILVVTHPHDDHLGGVPEILRKIKVDEVITNGHVIDSPVYQDFLNAVKETGVKQRTTKEGDKIRLGKLTFNVLGPRKINPDSINNNSIVMRLVVGKISFLFTGDLQELEEGRLVKSGKEIYADILKVPHHAADTSSSPAFIAKVYPSVAIYTAEIGNIHGFPHQKTIDTLNEVGADIYGTDVNGTITVKTDGKTYEILPEKGGPRANPADQ